MGKIYAKARKVIAWTGLEAQGFASEDSESSAFNIERVLDLTKDMVPHDLVDDFSIGNEKEEWKKLGIILRHPGCEALSHLCCRRYWSRLWIIQELVLAKTIEIRLGRYAIKWISLES
jgi:hypothetical protein